MGCYVCRILVCGEFSISTGDYFLCQCNNKRFYTYKKCMDRKSTETTIKKEQVLKKRKGYSDKENKMKVENHIVVALMDIFYKKYSSLVNSFFFCSFLIFMFLLHENLNIYKE